MEPDYLALQTQAEADVARELPPPQYPPFSTASYAALAAVGVCIVYIMVVGLRLENPKVMQGVYITAALAWIVTFFPLRAQDRRHSAAVSKRFLELVERAKAQKH